MLLRLGTSTSRNIASSQLRKGLYTSSATVCHCNQPFRSLHLLKKESTPPPIQFKDIKCDNNHITWPRREFVDILSKEIKRASLLSKGDAKRKSHKSIENDFNQLAAGMERLLHLQTWDEVDATANRFKIIDPDGVKIVTAPGSDNGEDAYTEPLAKEKDFLKHLAPHLKQAGYSEISQKEVKDLFGTYHKYGDIELKVDFDDFDFIRVWVFGRSGGSPKERATIMELTEKQWKKFSSGQSYEAGSDLCHRRVVIAAKSKKAASMIFKCFKDVPVGHFEALIPQAKIRIPWKQKWFWNIFLFSSGVAFFFNVGLRLQSEQKLGFLVVVTVVMSFIVYRTRMIYRNMRNRYDMVWKQMLYYKSTSNNSALAMEVLNRARGQNFKKTILTYVAALQVANRSKDKAITSEQITGQCDAWFNKVKFDHPDREVGAIDFSMGIRNLLNIGILTYTEDNKAYEVADVVSALKKVREELLALCAEICDSS